MRGLLKDEPTLFDEPTKSDAMTLMAARRFTAASKVQAAQIFRLQRDVTILIDGHRATSAWVAQLVDKAVDQSSTKVSSVDSKKQVKKAVDAAKASTLDDLVSFVDKDSAVSAKARAFFRARVELFRTATMDVSDSDFEVVETPKAVVSPKKPVRHDSSQKPGDGKKASKRKVVNAGSGN